MCPKKTGLAHRVVVLYVLICIACHICPEDNFVCMYLTIAQKDQIGVKKDFTAK